MKPTITTAPGRLIMRDQSGGLVGIENVDEDMKESNGFKERGQITSDE